MSKKEKNLEVGGVTISPSMDTGVVFSINDKIEPFVSTSDLILENTESILDEVTKKNDYLSNVISIKDDQLESMHTQYDEILTKNLELSVELKNLTSYLDKKNEIIQSNMNELRYKEYELIAYKNANQEFRNKISKFKTVILLFFIIMIIELLFIFL